MLADINLLMTTPEDKEMAKEKSIEVVERPIPKELIKQRDGGFGKKLDYIGGDTVIKLLNEAFGYTWSFQVVEKKIIPSEPKQVTEYNQAAKKRVPVFNQDGTPKMESQPSYVEVLGRLSIPGIGVKEQYGTKILLGGASEQEGASKSAATDALKKCATLVGIGLELYGEKEGDSNENTGSGYQSKGNYSTNKGGYNNYKQREPERTYTTTTDDNPWVGKEKEIRKLKELKVILGVEDNAALNSYVVEFTGSKDATYEMVTPQNISAFNKFLEKKAEDA